MWGTWAALLKRSLPATCFDSVQALWSPPGFPVPVSSSSVPGHSSLALGFGGFMSPLKSKKSQMGNEFLCSELRVVQSKGLVHFIPLRKGWLELAGEVAPNPCLKPP